MTATGGVTEEEEEEGKPKKCLLMLGKRPLILSKGNKTKRSISELMYWPSLALCFTLCLAYSVREIRIHRK